MGGGVVSRRWRGTWKLESLVQVQVTVSETQEQPARPHTSSAPEYREEVARPAEATTTTHCANITPALSRHHPSPLTPGPPMLPRRRPSPH